MRGLTSGDAIAKDAISMRMEFGLARRRSRLQMALLSFLAVGGLGGCHAFGEPPAGARLERLRESPQYDVGEARFVNPLRSQRSDSLGMLGAYWNNDAVRRPREPMPLDPALAARLQKPPREGLRVSWVGHSTMLIELDGRRVLTDPVFSDRASPFQWLGPLRFSPPAIEISELPPIDAVLISHDHYDHLDMDAIRALDRKGVQFLVPLGVGAHLEAWGVDPARIEELDWWEETRFAGLTLVCLPARHFSGRRGLAGNRSLWASWAVIGREARVYFSGDTSMTPDFLEIGRRYGPFEIAMIEAAAYNPFWADYHLGPEQAVEAFVMLRGRLLVPIHWGTFDLALHSWTEPMERMRRAAADRGVRLVIPIPGGSVLPSSPLTREAWWPVVPWKGPDETPVRSSGLPSFELPPVLQPLSSGDDAIDAATGETD